MSKTARERGLGWPARIGIAAAALAFGWIVLRSLVIDPVSLPSSSMQPTIEADTTAWVRKWRYGPLGRLLGDGGPRRGDVVMFRTSAGLNYVKRVVAVGGDTVRMEGGRPVLNGTPLVHRADGTEEVRGLSAERILETLPSGRSYATLDMGPSVVDDTQEWTVPEGHVFVMGDNRDGSDDSRLSMGFVPVENVIGDIPG